MGVTARGNPYRVPALERGLRILALFEDGQTELAAPEICRALQLPRTSVFRIILTLEAFGYLERAGSSAYRIGPTLRRIAPERRDADRQGQCADRDERAHFAAGDQPARGRALQAEGGGPGDRRSDAEAARGDAPRPQSSPSPTATAC